MGHRGRCDSARIDSSGADGASSVASNPRADVCTPWAKSNALAESELPHFTSAGPAVPTPSASGAMRRILSLRLDGPYNSRDNAGEWLLYDRGRFEAEEEDLVDVDKQMRKRPVCEGSFDPETCSFSADASDYPLKVVLAPARNRCLVCGGTAGSHAVITPVALGTSAAVRVISEGLVEGLAAQHRGKEGHDGKERLLIFSDSRQDAAHQARFITYAGRYDRMRRRVVRVLESAPDHGRSNR